MWVCPKCSRRSSGEGKICRACGAILVQAPDDGSPETRVTEPSPIESQPQFRAPLGLPSGSVRALLTLIIVAVVIIQIVRGQQVELLWTETLMIALAHYFTSRRLISLPSEVTERLTAEGLIQPESRPLFLPRHSIRVMLVLAFVGLAVYLYQHDRLADPQAWSVLGVVFAYFLGIVVRLRNIPGWEDAKAAVVLVVLLCTAAGYLLLPPDSVPHVVRNVTLGLVLFYFGSR